MSFLVQLVNARRAATMRKAFTGPDAVVVLAVIAFIVLIGQLRSAPQFNPAQAQKYVISLDPVGLPLLALRSTVRMFIGLLLSLGFALAFGYIAARVKALEGSMVSLLDILQSVPVLGFISASAGWFITAFPNSSIGLECLSIFAVFSSQAWNMGFSFYQSLKTQPRDAGEALDSFGASRIQKFMRLDLPSGVIGLVWNAMVSFGGGWFFVAYSETIEVNKQTYVLPGLGSYLAEAIKQGSAMGVTLSVITMTIALVVSDQLFWRPLTAWSEKFRLDKSRGSIEQTQSWVYDILHQAKLPKSVGKWWRRLTAPLVKQLRGRRRTRTAIRLTSPLVKLTLDPKLTVGAAIGMLVVISGYYIVTFLRQNATWADIKEVFGLALLTYLRVAVTVFVPSVLLFPVGVWIGLNAKLAKKVMPSILVFSSFPTNFLFPPITVFLLWSHLSIDYGSIFLFSLGSIFYILFNCIGGAAAIPQDMREMSVSMGIKGWNLWKRVYIPAVFPAWVAGAVAASGGAWNASIACEYVQWGNTVLKAHGLGSYIRETSDSGQSARLLLGVLVMCLLVVGVNRLLWQRLADLAEERYRMA